MKYILRFLDKKCSKCKSVVVDILIKIKGL